MHDTIEQARQVAREYANKWGVPMHIFEVIGGFEVVASGTRPIDAVLREEMTPDRS